LTKSSLGEELIKALRTVAQGRNFMSSSVAQNFAIDSVTKPQNPFDELNAKEFEIFRLLAQGKEIDEIADALKLSGKTIANYQSIIKKKLNVNTSIEIVKLALQNGLIDSNQ